MANPAMNNETFSPVVGTGNVMTLSGAINKSIVLVGIAIISALISWHYIAYLTPYLLVFIIGAFALSLVIIFKKETASYLHLSMQL